MGGTGVDWTAERVDELRRLWLEGHSAREIAERLNTTRNGILGKAFRLALARRKSGPPPPVEPIKDRRRPLYVPPKQGPRPPQPPRSVPVVTAMRRLVLVDLENHHCRWPVGNPTQPDFRFCAADRRSGATYCPTHQRAAFRGSRQED